MKSRIWIWSTAAALVAALTMSVGTAAQDTPSPDHQIGQPAIVPTKGMSEGSTPNHRHHHRTYTLIDLGTFGGPASNVADVQKIVNNAGTVAGGADTAIPDPYAPNCFDPECFVQHTFRWRHGALTDLGSLPGTNNSSGFEINSRGWIVGFSQNGQIDPLSGTPEDDPVLWTERGLVDLGTLGGNMGQANSINDNGQITGVALNDVPDPFTGTTQFRAFLWQRGTMYDLGTLGGPDAFGQYINNQGQVAGFSFTNSIVNPTTGLPTTDPFLWNDGRMKDLGTLGGTSGQVNAINNRGQVVGTSNLAGDIFTHGFLWDRGVLQDVGTFGGDNAAATWINEAGDVVGQADFPGDQLHDAFLFRHGVMTDLGNLGLTSSAHAINARGQIVGASRMADGITIHAFIWERRGPMVDLNALIDGLPSLELQFANYLNDAGQIAGVGVPAGCNSVDDGCGHAFLLIPDGNCDDSCEERLVESQRNREAAAQLAPAQIVINKPDVPLSPIERIRRMRMRYGMSGQRALPRD